MKIFKLIEKPNKFLSNLLLLIVLFLLVFVVPIIPKVHHYIASDVLFSFLFFFGIYALDKVRKSMVVIAIVAFLTQWIARFLNIELLITLSDLTNIIFIQVIIIRLIIQVARSKEVNVLVIFESINGYLFMGLLYAIWVTVLFNQMPGSFHGIDPETATFHDMLYFTYVTITTLGYGDITPQLPLARSLSILISTSGQLYVAIIIAMLVGKYAGKQAK